MPSKVAFYIRYYTKTAILSGNSRKKKGKKKNSLSQSYVYGK